MAHHALSAAQEIHRLVVVDDSWNEGDWADVEAAVQCAIDAATADLRDLLGRIMSALEREAIGEPRTTELIALMRECEIMGIGKTKGGPR